MFDIGGWEFLVVIVVAIIVIGPKDLPGAIRTVTSWIRRARELAREFQSGLDDLARETDVDNVRNEIQSGLGFEDLTNAGNSIRNQIEQTVDPNGEIEGAFKEETLVADDDGPFADNSFEEDEDIDGADLPDSDTEAVEPAKPADEVEIAEKDSIDRREKVSGQTEKKSGT